VGYYSAANYGPTPLSYYLNMIVLCRLLLWF